MGINVLSLFDGMSGAQQALERAGIKVDKYFASEVDKYAIKVTMANYPNTIQLGDVTRLDTSILPKIDILFAGSPCTDFSFAGKRKGLSTKCSEEILSLDKYLQLKNDGFEFEGQSYLFWEFMRIREEIKPTYFFLENVEMGEKWEKVLSKAVGVNGIHINSSLLSAQNRQRIYWLNWGMKPSGLFGDMESIISQPKDKGILLKDILQDNPDSKYTISEKMMNYMRNRSANYNNGKINYKYADDKASCINKSSASIDISENIIVVDEKYYLSDKNIAYINRDKRNLGFQMEETDDKSVCITANFTKQIPYNQMVVKDKGLTLYGNSQDQKLSPVTDKSQTLNAGHFNMPKIVVHNTMPRSSKTGKGGTGPLKREDGKTYCLDTGNTNAVEITYPITLSLDMGRYEKYRSEIENSVSQDKATTIDASYYKGFGVRSGACRQVVQEKQFIQLSTDGQSDFVIKSGTLRTHKDGEGFREVVSGKGATVPARGMEDGSGQNVVSMGSRIRRLTEIECARLQTIQDDYLVDSNGKFHTSSSQLYKMIGNGWTIDVIAYLLTYLPESLRIQNFV